MKIEAIPYDIWYKFDLIRKSGNNHESFIGYKRVKLYEYLENQEFIKCVENNENDAYRFFVPTEKFMRMKDAAVLEELCNKSIKDIMNEKVIDITKVPYDFDEIIEALNDVDGYFNKVNIVDSNLSGILRFHGFSTGCGPNGYSDAGTDKLRKYDIAKVFETITGKSYEQWLNETNNINDDDSDEFTLLQTLAEKFGYDLVKH